MQRLNLFIWRGVAAAAIFAGLLSVAAEERSGDYQLGPEDSLSIRVPDLESKLPNQPVRIDKNGFVDLPLVGRVKAAGKTIPQLEAEMTEALRKFMHEPKVSIHVVDYRSQPVSVLGSVNTPGVHQLQGPRRLVEILSLAGGVKPDAGFMIQITRQKEYGQIDIPGAKPDPTGKYITAEVNLDQLLSGKNPAENILVQPHDVISVPKADLVYVVGEVRKAGGYTLKNRERMTVLKAITLAEGLEKTAAAKHSRILRTPVGGGERQEIQVNISKILANKAPDMPLQPDDIVVVPNNMARSFALRSAEAALQVGTGIAVFRR